MRPLSRLALVALLAVPAAAEPYVPPPPDPAGCRRALNLLEKLAGREPLELAPGLRYHVQERGPDRGIYVSRESAGTAARTVLPGFVSGDLSYELRKEDGTALYAQFRFEEGALRAVVAGPQAFPNATSMNAEFTEEGMRLMTRARLFSSPETHALAYKRARLLDSTRRLPDDESARVLTCPKLAWAAAINLCRAPELAEMTDHLEEAYCRNNVCFSRSSGPRVPYRPTGRCER